ncbi:MAG: hypothetical protein ACREFT_19395, partial [Acetobacteraceae bacterium]
MPAQEQLTEQGRRHARVEEIGRTMRALHDERQALVTAIRDAQDAAMASSEALPARRAGRRLCAHADLDGAG